MVDAIILARGGSKRIPRKNVFDMCGLPTVAWSVIQCIEAERVDRVWLTTDDAEIADIGKQHGAMIIERPGWMSDDKYSGGVPVEHAMAHIRDRGNVDLVLCVMGNCPLRLPGDIDRVIEVYENTPPAPDGVLKSVLPCARLGHSMVMHDIGGHGAQKDLIDKTGRTLIYGAGVDLMSWEDKWTDNINAKEFYGEDHLTDKKQDGAGRDKGERPWEVVWYFAEINLWQIYHLDIPEEVEHVRGIMSRLILKGRGPEIYEADYADK